MCRNIKKLFNFEPPATKEEIHAASLQFIRKISGFNMPSKMNEAAFFSGVDEVTKISGQLLASFTTTAMPKNRQEETGKAKVRGSKNLGR